MLGIFKRVRNMSLVFMGSVNFVPDLHFLVTCASFKKRKVRIVKVITGDDMGPPLGL